MAMDKKIFQIYRGEPLGSTILAIDGEEKRASWESEVFEALLVDRFGKVLKTWSTESGTIELGTVTIDDEQVAYARFGADGKFTAKLGPGQYTLEVANVFDDDRAIDKKVDIIEVLDCAIRNGVAEYES